MNDEIKFEKLPEYVKDEIDIILYKLLLDFEDNPPTYTLTQIKHHVLNILVKKVSKGLTVEEKLKIWVEKGYISELPKETKITVFSKNKMKIDIQ